MNTGIENFLNQFDPYDQLTVESLLFNFSNEVVDGYEGGMWSEQKIKNVWLPVLPESNGEYRAVVPSNFADEVADAKSMGAAIAIYAITTLQNHYFSKDRQDKAEKYADLYMEFRAAIFARNSGLNQTAIYRIID